jgi:predicted nucleic acid-binding Zn ribbon protein
MPALALLAMVAGVPAHAHCEMCGTPVEVGERRCGSAACEEKFNAALKAKKRGMYMFIGLIFLVMLFSTIGRNYL